MEQRNTRDRALDTASGPVTRRINNAPNHFGAAKAALKSQDWATAFSALRRAVRPVDDFVVQAHAAKLFDAIPPGALGLRPIRVAILANSTVDHLQSIMRFWLADAGFEADIYVAPFGTLVQSVLDESSELYAFKPDYVWLFTTHRDVCPEIAPGADMDAVRRAVSAEAARVSGLWSVLARRLNCIVFQNNADIPAHDPFGNLSGASVWGARNLLRLFNVELAQAATAGVVVVDLDHLSSQFGKLRWSDDRYWFHSKHAFSLDASGLVAHHAARLVAASKGLSRKCVVLDLDNTLWGGVIGDDGLDGIKLGQKADGEAFVAFQKFVAALKDRGIILAVCSKNDEINAKLPFDSHPDMHLRLDDIAAFYANWQDKASNITAIAQTLGIGVDSLVFVDDNPAERELVRQFLPVVAVPELAEDPADYVASLAGSGYFEAITYSDDDRERSRYYLENARRAEAQAGFSDMASYLTSLVMTATVGPCDGLNLPRMAQLINKSNQFHLTGTRYSEAELSALANDPSCAVRYFRLRDRFGDNGLISVVVLRSEAGEMHIDTWVMSCRVLGRSMEEFICKEMIAIARDAGCTSLVGVYRPSAKNKLVSGLYARLGFDKSGEDKGGTIWRLSLEDADPHLTTYVEGIQPAGE